MQAYAAFEDADALGTFLDNHDQQRFLFVRADVVAYRAALLYTLLSTGIPIVYYGTEALFAGGSDPANREPLWPTGFPTDGAMYSFIASVIAYRKAHALWAAPQVQRYADDTFYAFSRGTSFVAVTNVGGSGPTVTRTITYHPYADGTRLCNLCVRACWWSCVGVQ